MIKMQVITDKDDIRCTETFCVPEDWEWMIENLLRVLRRIEANEGDIGCDPRL